MLITIQIPFLILENQDKEIQKTMKKTIETLMKIGYYPQLVLLETQMLQQQPIVPMQLLKWLGEDMPEKMKRGDFRIYS